MALIKNDNNLKLRFILNFPIVSNILYLFILIFKINILNFRIFILKSKEIFLNLKYT